MTVRSAPSLDPTDTQAVVDLRAALRTHRYDAASVAEALGLAEGEAHLLGEDTAVLLRRLPVGEPRSTLVSLFLLLLGVEPAEAEAALAPLSLDAAERLGVVRRDAEGWVHACVYLMPVGDVVLACDHGAAGEAHDHVMAPARSSLLLAHLTVRRPVDAALDVGTGCGFQALLAAGHAQRVVASDPSERALAFTRFNCALNEVEVEVRAGAGVEPVAGQRFDLVVANPPFVISPEVTYLYRDGSGPGHAFNRSIVQGASRHLQPGGLAQVLVHWVHADEEWAGPLRDWVQDLDCDAWLLRFSSSDPLTYAERWNARRRDDASAYIAAVGRWVRYLRDEGAGAVGFGMVVLRRRRPGEPPGRVWALELPERPSAGAGGRVWRIIDNTTRSTALDDEALLATRLERVDGLWAEQVLRFHDDGVRQGDTTLWLDGPLPARMSVSAGTVLLLSALDGGRTVQEAIDRTLIRRPSGSEPRELTAEMLTGLRTLLELGCVGFSE